MVMERKIKKMAATLKETQTEQSSQLQGSCDATTGLDFQTPHSAHSFTQKQHKPNQKPGLRWLSSENLMY